jgi:tetratricopeptide (TPR) repeat protein
MTEARLPTHVAAFERRIRWRALPLLAFAGLMVLLAATAAVSVLSPPRRLAALPEDPDVAAAIGMARGRLDLPAAGLRFTSELTGPLTPGARTDAADHRLARDVEARLAVALRRHRGDARISTALGHTALARRDPRRAERRYRAALDRWGHAPEAHLGLGVALATRSRSEPDRLEARRLELQALAQFLAVRPADAEYAAALYDRALMQLEVGRIDDARASRDAYLARDPAGPWADALRAHFVAAGAP